MLPLDSHAGSHGQLLEAVLPADLPHAPLLRGRRPHWVPRLLRLLRLLQVRSHCRRAASAKETLVPRVFTSLPSTAEGDRAPQLHQVPLVRLVLHDVAVAHALVDDPCRLCRCPAVPGCGGGGGGKGRGWEGGLSVWAVLKKSVEGGGRGGEGEGRGGGGGGGWGCPTSWHACCCLTKPVYQLAWAGVCFMGLYGVVDYDS